MALSFLSRWIFRIPLALVLGYQWAFTLGPFSLSGFAWGVNGLWWAWSIGAFASFVVGVLWFSVGNWQEGVVEKEKTATPGD